MFSFATSLLAAAFAGVSGVAASDSTTVPRDRTGDASSATAVAAPAVDAVPAVSPQIGPRGVRIIAHPGLAADTLSRDQVSRLFLKKSARWDDGRLVVPVDLAPASSVRATFTREVHRRSVDAVKRYWRQQIYSAREVPPTDRPSEAAVVAFVRATPGAVGYVSDDTELSGVKAITVVDR